MWSHIQSMEHINAGWSCFPSIFCNTATTPTPTSNPVFPAMWWSTWPSVRTWHCSIPECTILKDRPEYEEHMECCSEWMMPPEMVHHGSAAVNLTLLCFHTHTCAAKFCCLLTPLDCIFAESKIILYSYLNIPLLFHIQDVCKAP